MKSSRETAAPPQKTISVPLKHEPAPGWTTSEPPSTDEYERFRSLTRRLLQVPKQR